MSGSHSTPVGDTSRSRDFTLFFDLTDMAKAINEIINNEKEEKELLALEGLRAVWEKKNQSIVSDFLFYLIGHHGKAKRYFDVVKYIFN